MDPVAVANLAISDLGSNPITSFDDPQKAAQLVRLFFDGARDAVLEDRDWTFATKRLQVQADVDAPDFGYDTSFTLPTTVLRVVTAEPAGSGSLDAFALSLPQDGGVAAGPFEWVKEGRQLLCHGKVPLLNVKAIAQVTDSTLWSPGFCFAVSARLAVELAVPLTGNRELKADLYREYLLKLRDAAANDGRQGSQQILRAGSILARRR